MPVVVDQVKAPSAGHKAVENGNQGYTAEEIIQKNREEFIRRRTVAPPEKAT